VVEKFDHISDSIAMSRIMLAPMIISIGLQNKILQAMAMKVPCIVTSSANAAIHAPQHAIVEANSPEEFSSKILDLLYNKEKAQGIGLAGYEFVRTNYSWDLQNNKLLEIIKQAV
jgi:glycosyltransferase involved in cell wall biosynthesis